MINNLLTQIEESLEQNLLEMKQATDEIKMSTDVELLQNLCVMIIMSKRDPEYKGYIDFLETSCNIVDEIRHDAISDTNDPKAKQILSDYADQLERYANLLKIARTINQS